MGQYDPPRTLTDIITRATARFGKTNTTLNSAIPTEVTDQLREICSDFDYWFLKVEPGKVVPAAMPYAMAPTTFAQTLGASGRWLDCGWLLTAAGTSDYDMYSRLDISPGSTLWAKCEASRLHHVKVFDIGGRFISDVAVRDSDGYFSYNNYLGTAGRGQPLKAFPHTGIDGCTSLRLYPTPDTTYVVAASWQLAYPQWFASGQEWTNILLFYYPRVIQALVMMIMAEHHHEDTIWTKWSKILYGDARGRVRSDIADWGLVGAMRTDTWRRWGQQSTDLEQHDSLRAAVGRGGYGNHDIGSSYYTSPTPY